MFASIQYEVTDKGLNALGVALFSSFESARLRMADVIGDRAVTIQIFDHVTYKTAFYTMGETAIQLVPAAFAGGDPEMQKLDAILRPDFH